MSTQIEPAQLKQQIVEAARALFTAGVMQPAGHANLSARLPGDRMVLTGSGQARGLTVEQLAVVDFDGHVLEGTLDPGSAEIAAMHAGVYRTRSEAGAIIHTHSPHAAAFALANEPLPCAYEALLRFGLSEPVPVADWAPRGSHESVSNIVECLVRSPSTPALLLGNHGLLAWAGDPMEVARLVVILEEAAHMTLDARQLGGEKPFPADALERERTRMAQFSSAR
jgi:L-fuculose-phosphate aldolase